MQTINLDISCCGDAPQPMLQAKQGDVGRKFQAVITDNGQPYAIPAGTGVSLWYSGTSGEGNYTHIGGESATAISGNTVTVELIAQMLTSPGGGTLCLVLSAKTGEQLGLWNIHYWVEAVPGVDSTAAQAYYTAFSKVISDALPVAEKLSFPVPIANGGTGATTSEEAVKNLGISQPIESKDHPGCYYRIVDGVTEWLNPPMQWGVEYRTAERHSGKPVYVKWFDIGSLPNNTYKQFSPGLGNTTVVSVHGFYHIADYMYGIPKISNGGYVEIWYYIRSQGSNPYIQVWTKYDFSSATATFLLKYIK